MTVLLSLGLSVVLRLAGGMIIRGGAVEKGVRLVCRCVGKGRSTSGVNVVRVSPFQ